VSKLHKIQNCTKLNCTKTDQQQSFHENGLVSQ